MTGPSEIKNTYFPERAYSTILNRVKKKIQSQKEMDKTEDDENEGEDDENEELILPPKKKVKTQSDHVEFLNASSDTIEAPGIQISYASTKISDLTVIVKSIVQMPKKETLIEQFKIEETLQLNLQPYETKFTIKLPCAIVKSREEIEKIDSDVFVGLRLTVKLDAPLDF
eukprot:TRINITY_DN4653_c0_g1_i3.p1 TRINITY_DN4653_c0_g1~~TRINITY_DN4653_c0_g1_i3.p1  ORF type:complete len:170 (+),score=29.29 TRINITY_DN4653_c0_g1_i3:481-990(+)